MAELPLLNLGLIDYAAAADLMERLAAARRADRVGDLLLVGQHPPVITLGRGGGEEDLRLSPAELRRRGIQLIQTERGGRATYHGPGQLVLYPIMRLPGLALYDYIDRLQKAALWLLADYGLAARQSEEQPGLWLGREKIAALGVAMRRGVTTHGLALNVDPNLAHFGHIIPCGLAESGITSMRRALGRPLDMERVARDLGRAFGRAFDRTVDWGLRDAPWLVAQAAQGRAVESIDALLDRAGLHTVCEEALCPNLAECWGAGTATFMILGDICTRHCRFCAVSTGRPLPLDPLEPERLAETAAAMGLRHVVVTSVSRDDLPDGGAAQFAATIRAVRRRSPGALIEILTPDFGGQMAPLQAVLAARPDIFNHNLETVPRLFGWVQPRKSYRRSLALLSQARRAGLVAKSGLMLGLGERRGEVLAVMRDLRRAGCDLLTLGQYLQPTGHHLPVAEYIHPAEFDWYRAQGRAMGFRAVAAGPLVRSSYHAAEMSRSAPLNPPDGKSQTQVTPSI